MLLKFWEATRKHEHEMFGNEPEAETPGQGGNQFRKASMTRKLRKVDGKGVW